MLLLLLLLLVLLVLSFVASLLITGVDGATKSMFGLLRLIIVFLLFSLSLFAFNSLLLLVWNV